jgi:hypothetical protein
VLTAHLARGRERATHLVASVDRSGSRFSNGRHISHDADAIVIVKQ